MAHLTKYASGSSRTPTWSLVDDVDVRESLAQSKKQIPIVLEYAGQSVMTLKSDTLSELVCEGREEFGLRTEDVEVSIGIELELGTQPNIEAGRARVVRITEKVYEQLGPLSVVHLLVQPSLPSVRSVMDPTLSAMDSIPPSANALPSASSPIVYIKVETSPEPFHQSPSPVPVPNSSPNPVVSAPGSTPRRFLINSLATNASSTQRPKVFPFFNRRLHSQPLDRSSVQLQSINKSSLVRTETGLNRRSTTQTYHLPSPLSCSSSNTLQHLPQPQSPPSIISERSSISASHPNQSPPYPPQLTGSQSLPCFRQSVNSSGSSNFTFESGSISHTDTPLQSESMRLEDGRTNRVDCGSEEEKNLQEPTVGPIRTSIHGRRERQITRKRGPKLATE